MWIIVVTNRWKSPENDEWDDIWFFNKRDEADYYVGIHRNPDKQYDLYYKEQTDI